MENIMKKEREDRENEKKSLQSHIKHRPFLQKSVSE